MKRALARTPRCLPWAHSFPEMDRPCRCGRRASVWVALQRMRPESPRKAA